MTALTNLTNDELQEKTRACVRQIEKRLRAGGEDSLLLLMRAAHIVLTEIDRQLAEKQHLSARSGGTGPDKPAP